MPARIVDTHHHLLELGAHCPAWLEAPPPPDAIARVLGDIEPIRRTYLVDDYLADMQGLGLEKSVCVELGGQDFAEEAAWLQSLADAHGFPHGIVAGVALEDPGAGELLEEHGRLPNVRGVRQLLNAHPDPQLTFSPRDDLMRADDWRRGFALLARHGLAFELQCFTHQLADAAALARAFPDVPIVLDHAEMPVERDAAGVAAWREALAPLVGCQNVTVKVSGFGMIERAWTRDGMRPFAAGALELFGPDRCMFASNFPVERLFADAATLVADCDAVCDELGLGPGERDAFFAGTAERVYRL